MQKPRTEGHVSARGCNSVEAAGIEPADPRSVTPECKTSCDVEASLCAANAQQCGGIEEHSMAPNDPRLHRVIRIWPELSEAARDEISRIVSSGN